MAMKDGISSKGSFYYVTLREPDPATGKTKVVVHSGFRSEDEAKAFRDERRVALRRGHAVRKDKITVSEYLDRWLPSHALTKPLKPSTEYSYERQIELYVKPHIGGMKMQAVTSMTVSDLYSTLCETQSRRTVEYTGTLLKMAFKHAVVVYRLIETNPAEHVPIPRPKRVAKRTWGEEEMHKVNAVLVKHPAGALYLLFAATGCRRGEALGLRWKDIDYKGKTVTFIENRTVVGGKIITGTLKEGKGKQVAVDDATLHVLSVHYKRHLEKKMASRRWVDSGLVFTNPNGGGLDPTKIYATWHAICAEAGVEYLKPHGLRHTHATWLLEEGVSPHVVAERLGHASPVVTMNTYAQVTRKQSRQAADVFAAKLLSDGG